MLDLDEALNLSLVLDRLVMEALSIHARHRRARPCRRGDLEAEDFFGGISSI